MMSSPFQGGSSTVMRGNASGEDIQTILTLPFQIWDMALRITTAVPGDFNSDGTVDAADYVVWRIGLGTTYTQSDYDLWRVNFGQTSGSGAAGLPSGCLCRTVADRDPRAFDRCSDPSGHNRSNTLLGDSPKADFHGREPMMRQFPTRLSATRLIAVALATGAEIVFAGPYSALLVFGDSYSDTGNLYELNEQTQPPSPPYFEGRWSNGPLWVEQMASLLNVPLPLPSRIGGTNFAYAGARTGQGTATALCCASY
jgi:hypothetical protein